MLTVSGCHILLYLEMGVAVAAWGLTLLVFFLTNLMLHMIKA